MIVPKFSPAPRGSLNALETQCKAKKDTETCNWVVALDKHYLKLEGAK